MWILISWALSIWAVFVYSSYKDLLIVRFICTNCMISLRLRHSPPSESPFRLFTVWIEVDLNLVAGTCYFIWSIFFIFFIYYYYYYFHTFLSYNILNFLISFSNFAFLRRSSSLSESSRSLLPLFLHRRADHIISVIQIFICSLFLFYFVLLLLLSAWWFHNFPIEFTCPIPYWIWT